MILRKSVPSKKKSGMTKIGYLVGYSVFWFVVFVAISAGSDDSQAERSFSGQVGNVRSISNEASVVSSSSPPHGLPLAEATALIAGLSDPPPKDGSYAVAFHVGGIEHLAVYAAGHLIVLRSGHHYSASTPLPARIDQTFSLYRSALALNPAQNQPFFQYPRPTVEFPFVLLGERPAILYFPRIMSDSECDDFIALARPSLSRSLVMRKEGTNDSSVSEIRTSHQTWLTDNQSPTTERVAARMRGIVGIETAEATQILHYQRGQKYLAHHDYFDPEVYGQQHDNRAATFFLYLSTLPPFAGGDTYFPRAFGLPPVGPYETYGNCSRGLRVFPKKGAGALFFDQVPDGRFDPLSLHGSCPIEGEGVEKWGGTKWFRTGTSLMGPGRNFWE